MPIKGSIEEIFPSFIQNPFSPVAGNNLKLVSSANLRKALSEAISYIWLVIWHFVLPISVFV